MANMSSRPSEASSGVAPGRDPDMSAEGPERVALGPGSRFGRDDIHSSPLQRVGVHDAVELTFEGFLGG